MELDWSRVLEITKSRLQEWVDTAVRHLPDFAAAVLVVLVAGLAARIAAWSLDRVLRRANAHEAVARLVTAIARVLILSVGVFVALGILDLRQAVTSLLAGAGILGLALGFAFQDLAENLIAGIFLGIRKPFQAGDLIETNGQLGFVQTVNLRNTIIRSFEGQRILIPNKKAFSEILKNFSSMGRRRVDVPVGVTYDADLEEVTRILERTLSGLEDRLEEHPVQVVCLGFGSSSIDFSARFWITYPGVDFFGARHRAILAIKQAFDEAGVTIPFPIRTLDFDKGTLQDVLHAPQKADAEV